MTQLPRLPARSIALSAFVLTALMTACNPNGGTATVSGVTVSPASVSLPPSSTTTLSATVTGSGSFTQSVSWSSSDSSVAKVDATSGVVTAIKAGTATVTATSSDDTSKSGSAKVTVDPNATAPDGVKVNFQPATTAALSGYKTDSGAAYDDTRGYGWITQASVTAATASHVPVDLSKNTRDRKIASVDPRLNTFIHMQYTSGSADGTATPGAWEYKVPNGTYTVTVAVGDATSIDSTNVINVENQPAITAFTPVNERHFRASTLRVNVTDGRVTVDARGGTNTKLDYVIIAPGNRPSVATTSPDEGQTLVYLDDSFTADLNTVKSSNATGVGIDAKTLTAATVKLTNLATNAAVATTLNTSGGGDAIVLKPSANLAANTRYRVDVTSALKDNAGNAFLPYSTTFTTGATTRGNTSLAFTQVKLTNVPANAYTSVEIGPDGKLYAATLDGKILRFGINPDGTLAAPQVITSVTDQQGPRTIIGLKFDPSSTADNLILWISNNNIYDFTKGPDDWTGRITRLSGPNLATVQDVVTGLPRSVKDHMTNSVGFNPKEPGVLYVMQGSNSAMGAADPTWGNRAERLLNGAMLRLDLNKLPQSAWPLNAKTGEGGTYNPYAAGAPLTLYATGIRNGYDMVWHTNGQVYVPTNGSAAGGNTPAGAPGAACADGTTYSGPAVPALTNASLQNDYLFRVQPGGYYGHPNPLRCQFVMNGGNPTSVADPAEVVPFGSNSGYPVGTMPDKNYKGFAFNFGEHASANGAIEEYSTVSTAATKNKLMVVRYSKQKDIIVLTPGGANLDIVSAQEGVAGLTFSPSPLDLTENRTNGYLYVAQLDETTGSGTITLAKPK